ncbi:MAG: karyopherin beta [Candelina submexicana]|nr:MAG: karyopherin beta [Candelina submexicana]
MNVNQVLQNTLSPDASTRQNAEQQLLQAADVDFSGYLSTLAQELANEQAQSHIRAAAGIALKNSFSAREYNRLREVQDRWLQHVDPNIKKSVKDLALKTLASNDARAGQSAAQFIASIAAIELPRDQWPELMSSLVQNVGEGGDHLKQASLTTIGFICETEDSDLRDSLTQHSNAILTAVVQGARKEEANADVRNAAITALGDSLEFVRTNFENEGERNYIMQVICEATQSDDPRIQQGAFGCLNRIMGLYYDKMRFYMEKALFGLTIIGMKNDEEDVAKLAVEFWCTVCEEEISIEDDNAQAAAEDSAELSRPHFYFTRVAYQEVVPVLLELLTKQDEDATDDEYNISRAAYQCLQLYAQAIGGHIIPPVLTFVESNLQHESWHNRDAAVSAFGAIMEGPEEKVLDPLVKQALPVLIDMMNDSVIQVKDSAAYALGRICESVPESIDPKEHLPPLISAFFSGLSSNPKMAASCCWALMNLADRFAGDPGCQENPLSPHFQDSITHLLQVTERGDADNQLRTAAYEVLNSFVTNSAIDSLPIIATLSTVILERLDKTVPMQQQIVSVEDRLTLEEMQTSLTSVLLVGLLVFKVGTYFADRLEGEIRPQADRIMVILLRVLGAVGSKSSVPDTVFATIGALSNALETDFLAYMDAFIPYLYNALGNQDEPGLCAMAIGLVSDISRSLGEKVQPYCNDFMNYLLSNLRGTHLGNQFKPAILQTFGDIAQAIGGHFDDYLSVVAQVLQQAASVTVQPDGSYELIDYVISLREGIMDAWGGIIIAMKASGKTNLLPPYVDSIFQLLSIVFQDQNRSENLLRSAMGVIGDLADAFPSGEYSNYYRVDWVSQMIKETRGNRDFSARTTDTARWAREQVKRQTMQGVQQM